MQTINDILTEYCKKLDYLDLELIIAHVVKKPREFVIAHPEHKIPKFKIENLKLKISRRQRGEPLAYILDHKEFFGLDFKVNRHTLIPRPETELLIELVTRNLQPITRNEKTAIIDIGTGSGNIIISVIKNLEKLRFQVSGFRFQATDISQEALKIAKYNAKIHGVDKKIKFLRGNLLEPILEYIIPDTKYIILANLPYLSKEIYNATAPNVKKYEPRSALYSSKAGLDHYEKLLKQLEELTKNYKLKTTNYLEISPEQKPKITKLIKSYFPKAKIDFYKDLANKWRVCKIQI